MPVSFSTPLFPLRLGAIASHITWSRPSGRSIAREMGVDRSSAADFDELRAYDTDLEKTLQNPGAAFRIVGGGSAGIRIVLTAHKERLDRRSTEA